MPQFRSESTIKIVTITLTKDGDEFRLFLDSGQLMAGNGTSAPTISVELPTEALQLQFTTADIQVGTDTYVVEASTEVEGQVIPWTSDHGEHRSPLIERDPSMEGETEVYTKSMTLSFVIEGPVEDGAPPPLAGQIKPPTTVVIRSRL